MIKFLLATIIVLISALTAMIVHVFLGHQLYPQIWFLWGGITGVIAAVLIS